MQAVIIAIALMVGLAAAAHNNLPHHLMNAKAGSKAFSNSISHPLNKKITSNTESIVTITKDKKVTIVKSFEM